MDTTEELLRHMQKEILMARNCPCERCYGELASKFLAWADEAELAAKSSRGA